MPVTNWNTAIIDGSRFLVIDMAKLRIPLDWDPNGNVFLAVSAPDGIDGDALFSHPALVQGDPGAQAQISEPVDLTVLEYDDVTPDAASFVAISPGVYQYVTTQRKGPKGDTGSTVLHLADDLTGTITPGDTIIVNPTGDGFSVVGVKCGDWYLPGAIANTPSGNAAYTMTTVPVPPQKFDWRPICEGQVVVTGSFSILSDAIVDFVARLNTAGGNELARCFGITPHERLMLAGGPPTASPDGWDRIPAGQYANILFRTERQSGFDTTTTSATTTRCRVKVDPIPDTTVGSGT